MAPVQIARVQPVVVPPTRGCTTNPWLYHHHKLPPYTTRGGATHILIKINFLWKFFFLHLLPFFTFFTYFLWPKIVKNYPILFSWIIPFHRHPTCHILKIFIFGGFLGGFRGFSGGSFCRFFFKYKLDTPSHIRSHCAKFHDPSYLGTPSK